MYTTPFLWQKVTKLAQNTKTESTKKEQWMTSQLRHWKLGIEPGKEEAAGAEVFADEGRSDV